MFYKIIEQKRDRWLAEPGCVAAGLLNYMQRRGKLRDAQLDAIKTYLFLKIKCGNRPLAQLFTEGAFTNLEEDGKDLPVREYAVFQQAPPAAFALHCYAFLKDKNGQQLSPELAEQILENGNGIDYPRVFKDIFYGVDYADYVFSLPMGAGKTYLMAAFIYLDLYFAVQEPDNPAFAHNFMVLAPSGLKSSIIPSLRSIKKFDPSWVVPEPAATNLRRMVHFEVLDAQKSDKNSNRVKNPNAQKLANLQPFDDLMGLVAVTNAEKVILNKVSQTGGEDFLNEELDRETLIANELRSIIGKIPGLAIYIDEVHHAADDDIKLRQVVNGWCSESPGRSVLGFSGTPYLEKAEAVTLHGGFAIRNTDLSNVVYHYPLAKGVGNFLKVPEVFHADEDSQEIVVKGVRQFLEQHAHTVYPGVGCAKLAIYCGQIETLEETIYPLVAELMTEAGFNPRDTILKYHCGSKDKQYSAPEGAQYEFASLDSAVSQVKIILLVQIGKEGWDCRSLTGVILPHRGVCPSNMVLQTCCRCLRQVVPGARETALVWLNQHNAATLNKQLKQQQNITLQELADFKNNREERIERFSRMQHLKLPPIDFYQLKVSYETFVRDKEANPAERLKELAGNLPTEDGEVVHQQDLSGEEKNIYTAVREAETRQPVTFQSWLHGICKGSFRFLSPQELGKHEPRLREIFDAVTIVGQDGLRFPNPVYDQAHTVSLIRQCFVPRHDFRTCETVLESTASLLKEQNLTSPIMVKDASRFFPGQDKVKEIVADDAKPDAISQEDQELIERLRARGHNVDSLSVRRRQYDHTYHYLPYRFDSGLETGFFQQLLVTEELREKNLELYFNGDDTLTEFKVRCYKKNCGSWQYIGGYVPDFLILSRTAAGNIHQVFIAETKGKGYAANFTDKKLFMEGEFLRLNNEKFGFKRFDFIYLEQSLPADRRIANTLAAIRSFFKP